MLKPYVVGDRKQSVAINTNYIQTINAYIYATLYDKNVDVLDFLCFAITSSYNDPIAKILSSTIF